MEAYRSIIGHEGLIDRFGYWPSFHDAEVLSMCFSREHVENGPGPSMVSRIHVFGVDRDNEIRFIKHCIVTLEFDGLDELELNGFNHQNAIFGLYIESNGSANDSSLLNVQFSPAHGVECAFRCKTARVSSIEEGIPENSVYRK